jgi:hypothetical protein
MKDESLNKSKKLDIPANSSQDGLSKPSPNKSSSSSSDHNDKDGINWGTTQSRKKTRSLKDYHDSVIHMAVMQNDPTRLRDLLNSGVSHK